jgi:hypothetical protein
LKWLILGLFAALPLQWFGLGHTPFGEARLHQLVIFIVTLVILARYRLRAHSRVARTAAIFLLANVFLLAAWAAAALYQGLSPASPIQEVLYIAAFFAIATYIYRVGAGREPGMIAVLRWAAPVTCVSLLVGFSVAMVVNGVNPAAVLAKTVATGNPELFQKEVFKSSFASFGLDAQTVAGNLRHEIFGSLLLSMYVSSWAMRLPGVVTAAQRLAYSTAVVVGTILLAVSLSRSVLIAALVWPAIAFIRSLWLSRLSTRQLAITFFAVVGISGLALSGFAQVIWNRFTTDTTGYGAREQRYSGAFSELGSHWLLGGAITGGDNGSSHNFVLDNWLRGGLLAGVGAAVVAIVVIVTLIRLLARLPHLPDSMVPVTAALALPLVRMFTSGGGLITPVSWIVLAFVVGALAARREVSNRAVDTASPPVPSALAGVG